MARNVDAAVKLYSGDRPIGLFADLLPTNLERMNASFVEISAIFSAAGITDFAKLPDDLTARAAFAKRSASSAPSWRLRRSKVLHGRNRPTSSVKTPRRKPN